MKSKVSINIIMGFLGVGKTTAILDLLQQKPKDEKWAVLVNEFGEVGIDGAILSAESGMTISEVPGGCLCCVSGIPFQVALSNLIAQQQPDRILIEPTGLGHPKNLIRNLTSKEYAQHTQLKASICLIDPRQLKDPRYQSHETFNDQCYFADVLVANKTDQCSAEDKDNFYQFANQIIPAKSVVGWVENGRLDISWLDYSRDEGRQCKGTQVSHEHAHSDKAGSDIMSPVRLEQGERYRAFENQGMGYYSLGWLFSEDQIFDQKLLSQCLMFLEVERVKGLMITDMGARVMNLREQVFSEMPTRKLSVSRLEIIDDKEINKEVIEGLLLKCLL